MPRYFQKNENDPQLSAAEERTYLEALSILWDGSGVIYMTPEFSEDERFMIIQKNGLCIDCVNEEKIASGCHDAPSVHCKSFSVFDGKWHWIEHFTTPAYAIRYANGEF